MHPYVLISLLSALAAAILAGGIWARDPSVHGNRLAGLLLTCTTVWAACDVLCNTASDPTVALEALRWSGAAGIMVGPLAFHMLLTIEPKLQPRYSRFLPLATALAVAFAIAAVTTPAMWVGVKPTHWGWVGLIADGVAISWFLVIAFPVAALIDWLRIRDRTTPLDPWVGVAVCLPACFATLTDFVLPMAAIDTPRLGSASLVAWGVVAFGTVYRFRSPALAPHRFAREILEMLPEGVILLRLDGTIRSSNERMAELAGTDAVALMGRPIDEIFEAPPLDRDDPSGERELRLLRPAGEAIPVSVNVAPLHDEHGFALGKVLVVRDLREVISLRSRLIASGRLAAVGQLAAGIAHEINNPIAYVRSNLNLFGEHWGTVKTRLEALDPDPIVEKTLVDGCEMIREADEGLGRVASIVRDVSGFSKNVRSGVENADINELLDTTMRIARPQVSRRARVEKQFGTLPLLRCLAQELIQVFLNLLLNAAHSMKTPGTIRVVTEHADDSISIRVVDDGCGMDAATLEQIFTPFFTTQPVGEGTGLGLSISRQIISRHGGEIDVESEPGRGTTVRIRLPVGDAAPPLAGLEASR